MTYRVCCGAFCVCFYSKCEHPSGNLFSRLHVYDAYPWHSPHRLVVLLYFLAFKVALVNPLAGRTDHEIFATIIVPSLVTLNIQISCG